MGCCLCNCLIRRFGGQFEDCSQCYTEDTGLSSKATALINEAFNRLDPTKIVDCHCHLVGFHTEESGCYVHENLDNCCKCQSYAKKFVILQAAGIDIDNMPNSDKPYYKRLIQLYENFIPTHIQQQVKEEMKSHMNDNDNNKTFNFKQPSNINTQEEEEKHFDSTTEPLISEKKTPLLQESYHYGALNEDEKTLMYLPICPKVVLLGLDQVYNKDTGIAEPHNTSVYTPSNYVEQVTNANKHIFIMGPSINPYRKDCVDKLIEFKNKGCTVIKWLPNSMGIDPMDKRCDAFYDKLSELDMFLLSHTGQEHSLDDADYTVQEYGNPLRFKRALDKGVKIIMAHCASEGADEDLDDEKKQNGSYNKVNSCDLFIRMMRDEKYKGLLFGDISAITAFKRVGALQKVIQCEDIHDRLIYGSDYPIPAINGVVWYGRLVSNGLITNEQAYLLREIYKYNPILADFVSKRVMRYTDKNGSSHRFDDVIFQQFPLVSNNMGVGLSVKQKKDQ